MARRFMTSSIAYRGIWTIDKTEELRVIEFVGDYSLGVTSRERKSKTNSPIIYIFILSLFFTIATRLVCRRDNS